MLEAGSYTLKELPHPHVLFAFGLLKMKPRLTRLVSFERGPWKLEALGREHFRAPAPSKHGRRRAECLPRRTYSSSPSPARFWRCEAHPRECRSSGSFRDGGQRSR